MKNLADILVVSLSNYWPTVTALSRDELMALYEAFANACVRETHRKIFFENLDGHKPLTERVFKKNVACELEGSLNIAFPGAAKRDITVEVVWGSLRNFFGFRLTGSCQSIHKVFVLEGDAAARIRDCKREGFLFLSGAREELRVFPG